MQLDRPEVGECSRTCSEEGCKKQTQIMNAWF